MARLRKFVAYRTVERPYTRFSKYKAKNFVRSRPNPKIVHFVQGNKQKTFSKRMHLICKQRIQIRDSALESARQTSNKLLELEMPNEYRLTVRAYPHHILRENPLSAGAGADRMSTGMSHAFGKPMGNAAQVKPGKILITVEYDTKDEIIKKALKRASYKLPGNYLIS